MLFYYNDFFVCSPTWVNITPCLGSWTVGTGDLGRKEYQLGSWILYHGFIILSGSQVLFTSLMNGCPDTLWAAANCRAKRGEGALPWTFSWVELQKG